LLTSKSEKPQLATVVENTQYYLGVLSVLAADVVTVLFAEVVKWVACLFAIVLVGFVRERPVYSRTGG
jgi:hypothetical protein